jgi:predicted transcriptional regulator
MGFQMPCERLAKEVLPSVRSMIAKSLIEEKKVSLYSAAKLLGVTPAAISNYIRRKRGSHLLRELESDESIVNMANVIAERISREHRVDSKVICVACYRSRTALTKKGILYEKCIFDDIVSTFQI